MRTLCLMIVSALALTGAACDSDSTTGGPAPDTPDGLAGSDEGAVSAPPDVAADAGPEVAELPAGPDVPIEPSPMVWTELQVPEGSPDGLWGHVTVALGPGQGLLFGGTDYGGGPGKVYDDLWEVQVEGDQLAFTRVEATDGPFGSYCGCMAYDPTRDQLLMAGGRDLVQDRVQSWIFDRPGGYWLELPHSPGPQGAVGCALAYDAATDRYYLYGGGSGMTMRDETWYLDPTTQLWTQVDTDGPSARYDGELVSAGGGQLVLIAGAAWAQGTHYGEVWRFDTSTHTWTQLTLTGGPLPGRRVPWVTRVPGTEDQFFVGFGSTGMNTGQVLDDLWRLDVGAATLEVVTLEGEGPAARGFARALPGAGGDAGLLLGGYDNIATTPGVWRLGPAASRDGDTSR